MKKSLLLLFVILLFCSLSSCNLPTGDDSGNENENPADPAVISGTVTAVNNRIELLADETEISSGPYSVIITDTTEFYFENGGKAALDDVKTGHKVEISFNGQVMLSYPAQIVAHKVVIK